MDTEYSHWESHFRELRSNIAPSQGRFDVGENPNQSSLNKQIIDGTAATALRTLKSGMMAGMTPYSRQWFRLKVGDDDNMEDPEVQAWAYTVQQRMYEVLRASNAYRMLNTCYGDVGLYGTFGGMVAPNFNNVIHCHAFPMGSFRIASGSDGVIEYMHRDTKMTVAQMVQKFGYKNVSPQIQRLYDKDQWHDWIDITHAVEPRDMARKDSPMAIDKPFASYYWEDGGDKLLDHGGFGVNCILAPRWEIVEYEAWSVTSPGMMALGDAMQLQQQQRDKAIAIKKMYDPPLQGSSNNVRYRNIPGGVSVVNVNDLQKGGLRSIYDVRIDVNALREDIAETQQRIKDAMFTPLFLATIESDRRQVTAREIAERHEEKLLALGPVLESLDHSLLSPLIESTYYHMQEAGLIPPAPDSIVERPVAIEYISTLAQAQKAVGIAPIERTFGFAASLEQVKPGTMDAFDADEALREFSEQIGAPPNVMRTEEQVAEIRQGRAQAAQQQQIMENAQPMANAAKLISEASARGDAGLNQGAAL